MGKHSGSATPSSDANTGQATTGQAATVRAKSGQATAGQKQQIYGLNTKKGQRRRRSSSHHHHHHHNRRKQSDPRRLSKILLAIFAVLVVLVGVSGYMGYRLYNSAKKVRVDAKEAMTQATAFLDAAKANDPEALSQAAQKVSSSAHAMNDELQTMPWKVASFVPVYGSDVRSVQTLGKVFADLSDKALVPLSQGTDIMSLSVLMQQSSVNMEAVGSLSNIVRQASPTLSEAASQVRDLPKAHIDEVADVLERARGTITSLDDGCQSALPLLEYLPELLGANGPKRYLVLGNNIAEIHAIGGFTGLIGFITVDNGHITLEEFKRASEQIIRLNAGPAGATEEEIAVFGGRCDTHHGDHNIIPDFSRVGQLYYNTWINKYGESLDGVLSFDPMFLQRMLGLVGSIDTSFGVTVDETNCVRYLLNESLFWWDAATCDDFYKEVATEAFDRILNNLGSLDTLELLRLVGDSALEHRSMGWSSNPDIETALQQAGFALEMPHDPTAPVLGFYISDATTTKASYYLSIDSEVGEPQENEDGTKTYPVTITVEHHADRTLLQKELPSYLASNHLDEAGTSSPLMVIEETHIIAPEGGRIEGINTTFLNVYRAEHPLNWRQTSYQGLDTWMDNLMLDVGERCIITCNVVTSAEATEPLEVRTSPVVPHEVRGDE